MGSRPHGPLTVGDTSTTKGHMGWRERDYARFTRQESKAYLRGTDSASGRLSAPIDDRPHRRRLTRHRGRRAVAPFVLCIGVAAAGVFGWSDIRSFAAEHVPNVPS